MLDIKDSTLAFLLDEALEFIVKHIKEYDNQGNPIWFIEPCWWKNYEEMIRPKPLNNNSLINELQENLKKFD